MASEDKPQNYWKYSSEKTHGIPVIIQAFLDGTGAYEFDQYLEKNRYTWPRPKSEDFPVLQNGNLLKMFSFDFFSFEYTSLRINPIEEIFKKHGIPQNPINFKEDSDLVSVTFHDYRPKNSRRL